MNKLFIRVFYDSDNIKESSIWKIGIVDCKAHMLYIETLHDKVSEKLPEEIFYSNLNQSYFKGLTGVDKKLATLEMFDEITGTSSSDLNIFVDEDDKIQNKIISFIKEFVDEDNIKFIFKNSFEEVLFMNFMSKTLNDFNIQTINLSSTLFDLDLNSIYEKTCKTSIQNTLAESKDDEDLVKLLTFMRIILETLILKDCFSYITSKDTDKTE